MAKNNNNSSGGRDGKQNTYDHRLPLPLAYYWPHGWYKHSSQECTRKRPGHIYVATKIVHRAETHGASEMKGQVIFLKAIGII